MKQLKLLAGLCLLASLLPYARGQTIGPQTITGTGCTPGVDVSKQATIGMQITGSWSGTIQPEASIGGQSPVDVQVVPSTSSTAQSTITGNGVFTATVSGYSTFYLCGDTVTGTATIYFNVTQTSSLGRSAGGGGGTPGGTATQIQYNNSGAFGGVTGSSVSGANVTLGGSLTVPEAANPTVPNIQTTAGDYLSLFSGSSLAYISSSSSATFSLVENAGLVDLAAITSSPGGLTSWGTGTVGSYNSFVGQLTNGAGVSTDIGNNAILIGTSGIQTVLGIGVDHNNSENSQVNFAPTSGTAELDVVAAQPLVNQTGGANGIISVFNAYPVNTALVGSEYLFQGGTSTAVGGSGTRTTNFSVDSSGNMVAQGTVSAPGFIGTGSGAGYLQLGQGTAPTGVANTWQLFSPVSVTGSPQLILPGAAATGLWHLANSSGVETSTFSAVSLTADVSGVLPIANGGVNASSAVAGAVPNTSSTTAATWTVTPTLGASGTGGTLAMFPATGNFTTTWGSAATASNTILGFVSVPTTAHIVTCTTSSTTCTLTDGGTTIAALAPLASPTFTGTVTEPLIATTTNCSAAGTGANPSLVACSAAPSGAFSCATNASTGTCTVSTTAVTAATSNIFVQPTGATAVGTRLSVTCNTTADTGLTAPRLATIAAGSFTINLGTFSSNPECFQYWVVD